MDDNAKDAKTQKLVEMLNERKAAVASTAPCSLSDYREYVAHLPRASDEQIDNYVRFVCTAHSWYKHLPPLPPGKPFTFFVDPYSGYDRLVQRGGGVIHQERTDQSQRFHYTWMTTKEYRSRFGHLTYESGVGSQFLVQSGGTLREYAELPVFSTAERAYRIPPEVGQAGTVELTAIIHPKSAKWWVWAEFFGWLGRGYPDASSRKWPSETGGDEALREILDFLHNPTGCTTPPEFEEKFDLLLLPERQRLQGEMTGAINRVLGLLYD
jgi:hypothetical protein